MNNTRSTPLPAMPPEDKLNQLFDEVLKKMDLPVDKIRFLKGYDNQKKWQLVNDQIQQVALGNTSNPSEYLKKLSYFMDKKNKNVLGDETSTKVLRHIETSLRTNSIDWVIKFLDKENNGLKVLIEYMTQLLNETTAGLNDLASTPLESSESASSIFSSKKGSPTLKDLKEFNKNIGDIDDDIHVCVMCLRAIMNNKKGIQLVLDSSEAIYCIVRSMLQPAFKEEHLKTKTLIIQLLISILHIQGRHELVSGAFDQFRKDYKESQLFQTLMGLIKNQEKFHIEWLSSAIQFIDIFVNSVEDMNQRVYLQYEFEELCGLKEYLDEMANCESDELKDRITSYNDHKISVAELQEDSQQRDNLAIDCENLRSMLSRASKIVQKVEAELMIDKAALNIQSEMNQQP